MTGFTHMLIGGAIGAASGNPFLTAPAAFAAHFVFDLIPHNDYIYYYWNRWKFIYLSPLALLQLFSGGVVILLFGLTHPNGLAILTGGFFGLLPDLITGSLVIFGHRNNFFNTLHHRLHFHGDLGERFYLRFAGGQLLDKNKENGNCRENWRRIKSTGWGNLGWGIELSIELVIVFLFLRFLLG
ncbi:MAG: hypothetical protein AAB486_02755 [Patescibacteria group bacterium]